MLACGGFRILSLIDTSVVGTRSAVELAALAPGTMLCDYTSYIFTFLAIASAPVALQDLGSNQFWHALRLHGLHLHLPGRRQCPFCPADRSVHPFLACCVHAFPGKVLPDKG